VWEGDPEEAPGLLTSIYGDERIPEGAIIRTDDRAFLHLCRLAAGLESPTTGEPEVLAQLRQAIAVLQGDTPFTDLLSRALEAAVGVGRKIRRVEDAAEGSSLATMAASFAHPHRHVAILGAGAMARATAGSLVGDVVTVYARRHERVDASQARPWASGLEAFAGSPVLISTVPAHAPLYPLDEIEAALASRDRPLLLADLGMPPGFEWLSGHPMVSYVGIDEIASSVVSRHNPELDALVADESSAAWARLTTPPAVSEVIAAIVECADRAVDEEVRRFMGRLPAAEDPEPVLRQLAHTVARRVLHPPISYIGSASRSEAADLLGRAYGVIDD
jgi:glutamyl-tRNA reductase